MSDQDASLSIVDLEAGWQDTIKARTACKCAVCLLPAETRTWIDQKVRQFQSKPSAAGRGSVGMNTLMQYLSQCGLGLSESKIERHATGCLGTRGCEHYHDGA